MKFQSIKGFRDFYPDEMAARRQVFDTIDDTVRRYGFREVGTPALESLDLYRAKSGEEILDQSYSFEDKSGREVALTPELTPTVARMIVAKQQELSKPIKWFSTRPFWRYEEPQQGRFREFYQTNIDIFGVEGPEADAEVIAVADDMLKELGLSDEYVFKISHRKIIGGVLEEFGLGEEEATRVQRVVDKSDRLTDAELSERLEKAGLETREIDTLLSIIGIEGFDSLEEILDYADNQITREGVENLRAIIDEVERYGALESCVFDPSIVRGFDYYTGSVFECFDVEGELRSIFGGGRYDNLVERFGGQPMAAVGFAPGDATLELLLRRSGEWPEEEVETDYYVAVIGDVRDTAVEVASNLRRRGEKVELDLSGRGFSDQLSYADKINADKTVIVGERDLSDGVVTVKDMDSGEQEQIELDEFL